MKFRTSLCLGYVLIFMLVIVLAGVTHRGLTSVLETGEWILYTQKIIRKANLMEKLMVDMETGARGFLLTGKEEFLEPYNTGRKQFSNTTELLKKLVAHNSGQVELLTEIADLENQWQNIAAKPKIDARRQMNLNKTSMKNIVAMVEKGTGKRIVDELRNKFTKFIEVEKNLLSIREEKAKRITSQSIYIVIFGTLLAIAIGTAGMLLISRSIFRQVGGEPSVIAAITGRIAEGELDIDVGMESSSTGILDSIKTMLLSLRTNRKMFEEQDWLKTGIAQLNDIVRGEQNITKLSTKIISEMTTYMNAQIGALYLLDEENKNEPSLMLTGTYAYKKRKSLSNKFKVGEGLVGQAFLEGQQIVVSNVPDDYIKITSGLGESVPRFIVETPFMFDNKVVGVIEIGTIHEMTNLQLSYLEQAVLVAGISFNIVQRQEDLEKALKESQELSEELQAQSEELQAQQEELQAANEEMQSQQDELKTANEELEEQTMVLKQSEGSLMSQQEALQAANEELEEKTDFLEQQRTEIIEKNNILAKTGVELETKAKELEISSRYKSEFLANMSHELRTPLNSILLLSRDLAQNKDKHLDDEEVESAEIVYKSGDDLLNLINEILNLSKIESGKMTLELKKLKLEDIGNDIKLNFARLVKEKGLTMKVDLDKNIPSSIKTDSQKFDQIIKNLIFNASKFTDKGSVDVLIHRPLEDTDLSRSGLLAEKAIAVSVIDSGIGIPEEKQQEIFEAFQQADGSTSRKYGGTGLGLSISRELSKLLGGEIQLESTVGQGSTFTLYLPEDGPEILPASEAEKAVVKNLSAKSKALTVEDMQEKVRSTAPQIPDDRKHIKPEDNSILIIEDDPIFAKILIKQCRENGFKCLTAQTGQEGLKLAADRIPKAIILDIRLPETDGWEVMDELKSNPNTSHIPIHVMSSEDNLEDAFSKGVVGTLNKPVSKEDLNKALSNIKSFVNRKKKTLLIVEDNEMQIKAIKKLIGSKDVKILEAGSGEEAITLLKSAPVDCMILDLKLPDISGFELLDKLDEMEEIDTPPVVVYTGKDLSKAELAKLEEHSETVIVKGGKSEERLLDETALFLHQVIKKMPKPKQAMLSNLYDKDSMFDGQKILVVDDDMRNVFAISKILKQKGVVVLKAENGKKALMHLEENNDIDLILMDIMMPEMNGYETIRRIRDPKSKIKNNDVLIFALTAKAMKKDREKCIEAGANDYLSKPVDTEKLFSMMRVWLYK